MEVRLERGEMEGVGNGKGGFVDNV